MLARGTDQTCGNLTAMPLPKIIPIPAFQDNYFWLLVQGRQAVVVDPGDARPVLAKLAELDLNLAGILLTHHHPDHIAGVAALASATGARVIGHAKDRHRLPPLHQAVEEGETLTLDELGIQFSVMATPGHTLGHICYFSDGLLLAGDTLFSGGCGRMFEGNPLDYHHSLMRLAGLPGETLVCCAHEYTLSNLRFAHHVLPDDPAVTAALRRVQAQRDAGQITLPSSLGSERQHNLFLRCAEPQLAEAMSAATAAPHEVFGRLRAAKDRF